MPFYLDAVDVAPEVSGCGCESVLIVPCRFCPAASLAVRKKQPYLQPFRRLLKTAPYESLIEKVKESLERRGIRTSVLRSRLLHQFVLCMWTSRRRRALRRRAKDYDALVVMGCEGAVQTVQNAVGSDGCEVIQGMRCEGLMSVKPRLSWPGDLTLELESVNPLPRLAPRPCLGETPHRGAPSPPTRMSPER